MIVVAVFSSLEEAQCTEVPGAPGKLCSGATKVRSFRLVGCGQGISIKGFLGLRVSGLERSREREGGRERVKAIRVYGFGLRVLGFTR